LGVLFELHLAPTLPVKPSTVNSCNFNYKRDRNSVKSGFTSFSLTFHVTKICLPTGDYDAPCPYPYTYTLRHL